MDFYNRQLITTSDGSHTLLLSGVEEHYHSVHGAVQESQHVFIRAGLDEVLQRQRGVRILEIGFGTGLNAWLTLLAGSDAMIQFTSLEAYPVAMELAVQLNYPQQPGAAGSPERFAALHGAAWNEEVAISPEFTLLKLDLRLEAFAPAAESVDLIYFDAFAPNVQPELWTAEVFAKLFAAAAPGAVLTTYCAKGQVRRNMVAAGFVVERLQGPPGKREMLRARKPH